LSNYDLSDEDKQSLPTNSRHRQRSPDAELFSVINVTLVVDIEYWVLPFDRFLKRVKIVGRLICTMEFGL
jgi:hypothetical protein